MFMKGISFPAIIKWGFIGSALIYVVLFLLYNPLVWSMEWLSWYYRGDSLFETSILLQEYPHVNRLWILIIVFGIAYFLVRKKTTTTRLVRTIVRILLILLVIGLFKTGYSWFHIEQFGTAATYGKHHITGECRLFGTTQMPPGYSWDASCDEETFVDIEII